MNILVAFVLSAILCATSVAASSQNVTIPSSEYRQRRQQVMSKLGDGILLVHARSALVNEDQLMTHGFHQDATFYYFTGLANAVSAILAIDGHKKESWLFVPRKLRGMGELVRNSYVPPGQKSELNLQLDHVVDWEAFPAFMDRYHSDNPKIPLYVDDLGAFMFYPSPETNPASLGPVDDPLALWRRSLSERWPSATIKSASDVIRQMRLLKSEREIGVMRRVAEVSASALRAGLRSIRPQIPQREAEAEIVRECMRAGGEGPSFWPLAASGSNSRVPDYLEGLADYRHMNRIMQAGEVIHLDLGCDVDHYGGDVGRTVPVSGSFTPGQREVWNLLVDVYRAGISVMRDGTTRQEVFSASVRAARAAQPKLTTPLGKRAAEYMVSAEGTKLWYLHSSGVECCETEPEVLHAGMIAVFEPSVTFESQGFYLEDMVLITQQGNEILTAGLPYSAQEIERAMKQGAQLHPLSK